jgi:Uma2 family endonuclease
MVPLDDTDNIVHLWGTWADFQRIMRMRGDTSNPRLAYLGGWIEIMAPSRTHEQAKSTVGCLLEAFCFARGIRFDPLGSWTLKKIKRGRTKRGQRPGTQPSLDKQAAEPDECYLFGPLDEKAKIPHLVIEVVWTSTRLDKHAFYRDLGIRELWHWWRGELSFEVLVDGDWVEVEESRELPGLRVDMLTPHLSGKTAYDAVLDFRRAL